MYIMKRPINFRIVLIIIVFVVITRMFFYYRRLFNQTSPYVPRVRLQPPTNSANRKVSIAHYTTSYGTRHDSRMKAFNETLEQICEIYDPEDYVYADSVIVSLVDFVRFPTVSNSKEAYRKKYKSQLWVLHLEESPRNSYRTAQINNITELDDWFNLTSSLRPESDLHVQYKGYRIKPAIANLLQNKLNINLNHSTNLKPLSYIDTLPNSSSNYLKTLKVLLQNEFNQRLDRYSKVCPYTCNQPLPSNIIQSLEPYLDPIVPPVLNRDIVYIAWFVTNCDTHSGREEYVLKLRSQPGIRVDIYGGCSSIFHSFALKRKCPKKIRNCIKKILPRYRFYLSFENSKCDTYITEKYWMQGLNGKAVPIVLGAKIKQYERIAVPNSYIHVDNFPTVEALAQELHRLNRNDSEFVKYLQWTRLYDVSRIYSPFARYSIYVTLCLLGHYQRVHAIKEEKNEEKQYLLKLIRNIFNIEKIRLPNFIWKTATTKLIRISEFYNPKVNCWDNEFPRLLRRIYNYLFVWWKLF